MHKSVVITNMKKMGYFFIILLLGYASLACGDDNCCTVTEAWVDAMPDGQEILRSHIRSICDFSGGWVGQETTDTESRTRLCNDLVLIWAHKECIYFRDYVSPNTYEPCKAWSREMFDHCMAIDASWFDCHESRF